MASLSSSVSRTIRIASVMAGDESAHGTLESVSDRVCRLCVAAEKATGISRARVLGTGRDQKTAFVRHLCMFLTREAGYCLQETSEAFNRIDHATTIYAVNKVTRMLKVESRNKRQPVRAILRMICEKAEMPVPEFH